MGTLIGIPEGYRRNLFHFDWKRTWKGYIYRWSWKKSIQIRYKIYKLISISSKRHFYAIGIARSDCWVDHFGLSVTVRMFSLLHHSTSASIGHKEYTTQTRLLLILYENSWLFAQTKYNQLYHNYTPFKPSLFSFCNYFPLSIQVVLYLYC